MIVTSHTFSTIELQALLNDTKDKVIAKINEDNPGLRIKPEKYLYIVRLKGCFGKLVDKIYEKLGIDTEKEAHFALVRVEHPVDATEKEKES